MYTLGAGYIPAASHASDLRFHGMSPIVSKLYDDSFLRAKSYKQTDIFEVAVLFARLETILPAPESAHAIKGAIDEALACKESGEAKTILFGLTGTSHFDMTAYAAYTNQTMTDYPPTDAEPAEALDRLPVVPGQD